MPYLQNAMSFVVEALLGFYLIICILRFLFQLFRVDFRNPISQLVVVLTNAPLRILRGFIPGLWGIDLAGIVLILVVGIAKTLLLLSLSGIPINFTGAFMLTLGEVINTTVWVFIIAILASAIISWVAPTTSHPAIRVIHGLSEPGLYPFRKLIPAIGGIDISPIFALLALNLVQKLVVHPITDTGKQIILGSL